MSKFGVKVEGRYLRHDGMTDAKPYYPFPTEEAAEARAKSAVLSDCEWQVINDECDCHMLPERDMDGGYYDGVCKKCEERQTEAGYDKYAAGWNG